ncbi:hypothetical protein HZS_8158, partial [Henneguya salminicola]
LDFACVSILNISGKFKISKLFFTEKIQSTAMDDRFKLYDKNINSIVDMRIRFFKSNPKNISVIFSIKTKVLIKKILKKFLFSDTNLEIYYDYLQGRTMDIIDRLIINSININTFNIISLLNELFYARDYIDNLILKMSMKFINANKTFTYNDTIYFRLNKFDQYNKHKYYIYMQRSRHATYYLIIHIGLSTIILRNHSVTKLKIINVTEMVLWIVRIRLKIKNYHVLDLTTINPCNHGGVCKHYENNTHLTHYCMCSDKHIGNRCQHINNCVNCKVSQEKSSELIYNCRAGWFGSRCEHRTCIFLDHCISGICIIFKNKRLCNCYSENYVGKRCEYDCNLYCPCESCKKINNLQVNISLALAPSKIMDSSNAHFIFLKYIYELPSIFIF